jgi:tetratricopeptide (TPR) repeat protein
MGVPIALASLGQLSYLQGDLEAARGYWEKSQTLWLERGNRTAVAWMLNNLGLVADRQGRYEEARWILEQGLTLRQELGDRWGVGVSLQSLGEVARHQGDRCRAMELFREALAVFRSEGIKLGMVHCLESMGRAAAESISGGWRPGERAGGEAAATEKAPASCLMRTAAAAARLFGAADGVRDALGTPLQPVDRADHERCVDTVRSALGEEAFAAAQAEGRALELEQAVAYALDVAA